MNMYVLYLTMEAEIHKKEITILEMTNQENVNYYNNSIRLGKSRLEQLLDQVESERHFIKFYQEELDRVNRIILEEQVRAEVLAESKLKGVK